MLTRRAMMVGTAALAAGCSALDSSLPSPPQATALAWHALPLPGLLEPGGVMVDPKVRIQKIIAALQEDVEGPHSPARGRYSLTGHLVEFSEPLPINSDEIAELVGNIDTDLLSVDPWFARDLGKRGVILPLDPYIAADEPQLSQEFYPYVLDQFREEGRLYALPIDSAPQLLHYDAAYLAEQGVPPPDGSWDWDVLIEYAVKLTQRSEDGTVERWGLVPHFNGVWWALWQNEAGVIDPVTAKCRLQEPAAIEALQFCHDLLHVHRVAPPVGTIDIWGMFAGAPDSLPAMFFSQHAILPHPKYRMAEVPRGRVRSVPVAANLGLAIAARTEHTETAYVALQGLLQTMQRFVAVPAKREAVARLGEMRPGLLPKEVTAVQNSLEYGRPLPWDELTSVAMQEVIEGLVRGDRVSSVVNAACSWIED